MNRTLATITALVAFTASAAFGGWAYAQGGGRRLTPSLTAQDHVEITQLYARFNQGTDFRNADLWLSSCAPGFSWTLDCERVTRRRRVEMGKPDQDSAAAEGARRAIGDAAGSGRGGRFSVGRKRAVVLRLLRGEDLESVSRAVGITAARASQWRERFLAAGQASLKSRAPDARDDDNRRLQAKIGELLMENELLDAKVDQLEAGGPLARRRSRR